MKITVRPHGESNSYGRAYVAVNESGEVIDHHFCSTEAFGKSDLGYEPLMSESFYELRRKKYAELYPEGFSVEWNPEPHKP